MYATARDHRDQATDRRPRAPVRRDPSKEWSPGAWPTRTCSPGSPASTSWSTGYSAGPSWASSNSRIGSGSTSSRKGAGTSPTHPWPDGPSGSPRSAGGPLGPWGRSPPQQVLDHFARNTEAYHIQNEFQILRAPLTLGSYIQALLDGALGASAAGVREIAREINRAGGARLLDAMERREIRELLDESTDRVMRVPEFVSEPQETPGKKESPGTKPGRRSPVQLHGTDGRAGIRGV